MEKEEKGSDGEGLLQVLTVNIQPNDIPQKEIADIMLDLAKIFSKMGGNGIEFKVDGAIESTDVRFAYTIEKCKISRTYLRDERRKLLNDFKEDISAELLKPNKAGQLSGIQAIVDKFKRDSEKLDNSYIAFRRYAIKHNWLRQIIKELL